MKVREVIALVEADGWYLVRTRGDYRQYKPPTKPGLVTIAGNRNRDVPTGTLTNILRQAGLIENCVSKPRLTDLISPRR